MPLGEIHMIYILLLENHVLNREQIRALQSESFRQDPCFRFEERRISLIQQLHLQLEQLFS